MPQDASSVLHGRLILLMRSVVAHQLIVHREIDVQQALAFEQAPVLVASLE